MEKLKVKIEESVDKVSLLENIAYYILVGVAFLLPIFFIPSVAAQFQFSKVAFLSITTLVSFGLWLIARLKDGRYALPNNIVFLTGGGVLLATLLSSFFSPSIQNSFLGQGSETGTWASMAVLFLVLFMFSVLSRPKERVFYIYLSLFASCVLIVVFHTLRFVLGESFLSFGIFTDITSNLIGKWNDLGIFFGLVALLSLVTIELMPINRFFKVLLWILFVLSVISLAIVNFPTLWYILAVFSLLYFVYAYAYKRLFISAPVSVTPDTTPSAPEATLSSLRKVRRGSVVAILLIVLSAIFLVDSYTPQRVLGTWISKKFNVSYLEVRPNWPSTIEVSKATLRSDPVLGAGPNRFSSQWLLFKPGGVNESIFWNTDFASGIGLLSTQLVTVGILGFVAWLLFLLSVVYVGVKYLMTPVTDRLRRYLSVSSFLAALFLWSFFVFYIPSAVILALTFLFTGVFLASLYNERLLKPKTVSFGEEPKTGFTSVLVLSALLIGVVALSFVFGKNFLASAYFQRALIASNTAGDMATAEKYGLRALSLSDIDLYDRFLAEITLTKINGLLSNTPANASTDEIRAQFQLFMGDAVKYARAAVEFDNTNYQNWISLARVYESVVPLNITGAYESAKSAYDQARSLNPKSPQMNLLQARLDLANNDRAKAKEQIAAALVLKKNYTEAIFLLSQVQVAEGKTREAILSVESASVLAPNDPTVFFQLGLLKYNTRDYRGAIQALERSMVLSPSYSNAKYFLGLGYEKVNRISDALVQFNDIMVLNPDNKEVPTIIRNIKAGRDPFVDTAVSELPEKRNTLPVEEKNVGDDR